MSLALLGALVVPSPAATAQTITPVGGFLNPDADDGPGNVISDKTDGGTDDTYHFVLRVGSGDPDTAVSAVEIQMKVDDPVEDPPWEKIGEATRVGATDIWEFHWDLSNHSSPEDVDDDEGAVRALVIDSAGAEGFAPSESGTSVLFSGQSAATVEITSPANGDRLAFNAEDGKAIVRGTANSGTDTVQVFYTTTPPPAEDSTWSSSCGSATPDSDGNWAALCTFTGNAASDVTGIAARAVDDENDTINEDDIVVPVDDSGDAHAVTGYSQAATSIQITPSFDTRTVGFCSTYTAEVLDQHGNPIRDRNIDVHGTPNAVTDDSHDDLWSFAANLDDEGDASDGFSAPDQGHTTPTGVAFGCDRSGESDDSLDDLDSDSGNGTVGTHETTSAPDTKHIEGTTGTTTDFDGFQFSIASSITGGTDLTVWDDPDDDDVLGGSELSASVSQTWQDVQLSISPISDSKTVEFCNTYTATLLDADGNAIPNANLDVHAQGPDDHVRFAVNEGVEGGESDDFWAPDSGHVDSTQDVAGCDRVGEEPDGAPDDRDSTLTDPQQGVHVDLDGDNTNDIKHIEGATDGDGTFSFSIVSSTAGSTSITVWYDGDAAIDDDTHDTHEASASASHDWQAVSSTTVDAGPEHDVNPITIGHEVTVTVTDQNGTPIAGGTVRFRVTAGPHADNDLDGDPNTPGGYFGSCTAQTNGTCSKSYTGADLGTDTITVWINEGDESGTDPDPTYANDGDDPADQVTKQWFRATVTTVSGDVCIDVDPNTENNHVTDTHDLVAFVTDGSFDGTAETGDEANAPGEVHNDCSGNPLADVGVRFTITDNDPAALLSPDHTGDEDSEIVVTDENGAATVTLDNKDDVEGENVISADVQGTMDESGDPDVAKTWDTDSDGDGVLDDDDNCPDDANPGQEDSDEDKIGDACDDNTNTVTVEATDADAAEPDDGGTFTFTRTDTSGTPTVNYTVSGTATGGDDYETLDGMVTFGQESTSTVTEAVVVIDDVEVEGDETVIVTVQDGEGYAPGDPGQATVTIVDDEDQDSDGVANGDDNCPDTANPGQEDSDEDGVGDACDGNTNTVTVEATDADAAEPDDDGTFTFTRTDTSGSLNVSYTVSGTATGDDYQTLDGSVTFADGESTATEAVVVIDDGEIEDDETVIVTVQDGDGYVPGDPDQATVTIADDDDRDGDGVANDDDNCPDTANADQADADGDGTGNACDPDYEATNVDTTDQPDSTQQTGDGVCATFQAEDDAGQSVEGAALVMQVSGANSEEDIADGCGFSAQSTESNTTDANGEATFSYVGNNEGHDTIFAFVDRDGDEQWDSDEPFSSVFTITWEAQAEGSEGSTTRLQGASRWSTAIDVSKSAYPSAGSANTVILARGDSPDGYADALAGAPLAEKLEAPLLITTPDRLLDEVAAEIDRVLASGGRVILLGRSGALAPAVEQAIIDMGYDTRRIGGADRIHTSVLIAEEVDPSPDEILLARAFDFPDALTAGAAAAAGSGRVVVLGTAGSRNPTTESYLDDNADAQRFAIGGQMASVYPDATPVFGENRFKTAVAVAQQFFTSPVSVGIARSDEFPDSLTGGPFVGQRDGPMLLTPEASFVEGDTEDLHADTREYLCDNSASISEAFVFGGTAAIAESTETEVGQAIRGEDC